MAFVRCLILAGAIALVASINGTGQNLRGRLVDTDRRFESIPTGYNAEPVPEPLSLPASWKLSDLEKAYLDTSPHRYFSSELQGSTCNSSPSRVGPFDTKA